LQISQGYIIRILQHFATKLWNITNFVMLFHAMMEFCLDLLRSKFWLIGEWSIVGKTCDKSVEINNLIASCQQAFDNLPTCSEQAAQTFMQITIFVSQ
jgi:hypothetical protein